MVATTVKQTLVPKAWRGDLDAASAAALVATLADISLFIDKEGVIQDLAFGSEDIAKEVYGAWVGQPWVATVSSESRPKVEALLREAGFRSPSRWRQINHPSAFGQDVAIRYCTMQLGPERGVIAVGRSLQAIAALQQQLVDAQQSLERDYWRLRKVETRYRLLFRMTSEPILIVNAFTQRIEEANPAASQLLGDGGPIIGRIFPEGFEEESTQGIQGLLATVRGTGQAENCRARLAKGKREFLISIALFRQENDSQFLLRLTPLVGEPRATGDIPRTKANILKVIEEAPEGLVVTDTDGLILSANNAFLDLAQLATEEQARGKPLDRWLGRQGVDFNVVAANLREHHAVRLFATVLRGEHGANTDVELSAVNVTGSQPPCLGFMIRNVGPRIASANRQSHHLPRSVEQLTDLVGRVPLKELVRESTDLIERLCIEAALELTDDNRASAAELLGLSRQSLYVKLRRYGLAEAASEKEK